MRTLARTAAATAVVVVLIGTALGASVAAKQNNPCKLLKRSEITEVLGQPVSAARKGLTTGATATCEWDVTAAGSFPDGGFSTFIQRVGAKIAYDTNSQNPAYEDVPDFDQAYYDPATGALTLLKGKRLMIVQAVFITLDGGVQTIDRKAEVIELAELALERF